MCGLNIRIPICAHAASKLDYLFEFIEKPTENSRSPYNNSTQTHKMFKTQLSTQVEFQFVL